MKNITEEIILQANKEVYNDEADLCDIINKYTDAYEKDINNEIDFILSYLSGINEIRVLDLGCGTGFLTTKFLEKERIKITSVDISYKMLAKLREKIKDDLRVSIYNMDVVQFIEKEKNKEYHLICMSGILHHLFDPYRLLNEAIKKIVDDGFIYILLEPLKEPDSPKGHPYSMLFQLMLRRLRYDRKKIFTRIKNQLYSHWCKTSKESSSDKIIAEYHQCYTNEFSHKRIKEILIKNKITILREETYMLSFYSIVYALSKKFIKFHNHFRIIGQKNT